MTVAFIIALSLSVICVWNMVTIGHSTIADDKLGQSFVIIISGGTASIAWLCTFVLFAKAALS